MGETEDSFKLDIDVDKSKEGDIEFVSETSNAPDVDIIVEQEPGTLTDSSVTLDFPDSDFHFGKRADDSSSSSSSSASSSDPDSEDEKVLPTDDKDKKKEKKTKEKKEKKSKEKKEKKEKKSKEKKEKEPKEKKGKKTKDEKAKDKETEDSFKLDIGVDKSNEGDIEFVSETSIAPDVDIIVEQEPGTLPDSSLTLDFPDSDVHFGKRADDSSSSSSSDSDSDSDSEDEKVLPTDDKDKKKEKKTKENKEKKSKEKKGKKSNDEKVKDKETEDSFKLDIDVDKSKQGDIDFVLKQVSHQMSISSLNRNLEHCLIHLLL